MGWLMCCGGKNGKKANASLVEQIESAAKAAGKILEHGIILVPPAIRKRRRAICASCEYEGKMKCKSCGCYLILKRPLATEECPEGLWEAEV